MPTFALDRGPSREGVQVGRAARPCDAVFRLRGVIAPDHPRRCAVRACCLLLGSLLTALLLVACAPPRPPATLAALPSGFPLVVTDDAGRSVQFAAPPARLVSLSPGHTQTLYALGARDRLIATDRYSDHPAANAPKATLT